MSWCGARPRRGVLARLSRAAGPPRVPVSESGARDSSCARPRLVRVCSSLAVPRPVCHVGLRVSAVREWTAALARRHMRWLADTLDTPVTRKRWQTHLRHVHSLASARRHAHSLASARRHVHSLVSAWTPRCYRMLRPRAGGSGPVAMGRRLSQPCRGDRRVMAVKRLSRPRPGPCVCRRQSSKARLRLKLRSLTNVHDRWNGHGH
jgi:hypothetical protein